MPSIVPRAVAAPLVPDFLEATRKASNVNRKTLRHMMRKLVPHFLPHSDLVDFHDRYGVTFHKMIDQLPQDVLADLISDIIVCSEDERAGEHFHPLAWTRLVEAMDNVSVQRPKQRGSGTIRGAHTSTHQLTSCGGWVRCWAVNHGVPTTHTSGGATGATTNASTTTTKGSGMTNAPVFTIDDNEQTGRRIIFAAYDIMGQRENGGDLICAAANRLEYADTEGNGIYFPAGTWRKYLKDALNDSRIENLTIDDLDDDEASIVEAIVNTAAALTATGDEVYTSESSDDATSSGDAATPADDTPTIEASIRQAIDSLLAPATGGQVTSIESLLNERSEAQARLDELTDQLRAAQLQAASRPAAATSGSVDVDAGTLTYELSYKRAKEVFPGPDGRQAPVLDFDVPVLTWHDADGNEVAHPDVPAIEPDYEFRLRHLVKFLTAFVFGRNAWLHGHSGTGKTTLAEQIAARLGFPVERLNLDSNLERADIVGATEIVVENGAPTTVFREGILPRAMRQPCMFLLDEIDAGRPDVLFVIQRALEAKGLTLTEDGGRTVQPHELFRFIATANSRGQGDEHGWYQGVRPMNLAMLNRFGAFIEVPYLDRESEERLLKSRFTSLSDDEVRQFTQFTVEMREAFTGGEISQTVSPRNLLAMAEYYTFFKDLMTSDQARDEALEMTVIDGAPADSEQRIREIAARVFP